jgi:hypothetical protein
MRDPSGDHEIAFFASPSSRPVDATSSRSPVPSVRIDRIESLSV